LDLHGFIFEAAIGSVKNVLIMASFIIPIMIMLELAREKRILDRFSKKLAPALKIFGMSPESSFPLLAGIIFGISYGAGVIIDSAQSGRISWRDMFLVNIFLSVCHAMIEDTALFLVVGANPFVIIIGRFGLAIVITYIISRSKYFDRHYKVQTPGVSDVKGGR